MNFIVNEKNYDFYELLLKKKSILKSIASNNKNLREVKINLIGGYTSNEIIDWIKIFLYKKNIKSKVTSSIWGSAISNIKTENININKNEFYIVINSWKDMLLNNRLDKISFNNNQILKIYENFYNKIHKANAELIMLAFDYPDINLIINNKSLHSSISTLNSEIYKIFKKYSSSSKFLNVQQVISAKGIKYFNNRDWHLYGKIISPEASFLIAKNIQQLICEPFFSPKKLVILDLDNTLWGGIIGDDGYQKIKLGDESADGRIFSEIQSYFKMLKNRGLLLSIVSKNEQKIALKGLSLKKSILKPKDFVSMRINWKKKSENILSIQKELNIGLDSIVFIDDNPTERAEVKSKLPEITVPNIGASPENFIEIIDNLNLFSSSNKTTKEDKKKTKLYQIEKSRHKLKLEINSKDKFLEKCKIKIKFLKINNLNIDRVYQLTNKTNQFNFTTKRFTQPEIMQYKNNKKNKIIIVEASDKFGDYGLISVLYLSLKQNTINVDNWLMSCRVFNKTIEDAILYSIIKKSKKIKKKMIYIDYIENEKNKFLKNFLIKNFFKIKENKTKKKKWLYDNINNSKIKHYCNILNEI